MCKGSGGWRSVLALWVSVGVSPALGDAPPLGHWRGTATCEGAKTPLVVTLSQGADGGVDGRMGLPELASLGRPLEGALRRGRKVELSFGTGRGEHVLRGRLRQERLEGDWMWGGQERDCSFRLTRGADPRPYREEEVVFHNGDVTLAGTLLVPSGPGPHPGIVLMHGSGDNVRWPRRFHADLFARAGLVSLFFDKRGNGESTGDWRKVGFEAIARDGLAGLGLLRERSDVDPDRVGFWGISQAGWIMPLAASLEEGVAFIITVSGAAVSVEEEGYYDYLVRLRDAGFGEEEVAAARRLLELDFRVSMTGEGMEELLARVKEVRDEPWFRPLGYLATPPNFPTRRYYRLIGDYDPLPILERISTPILWLYGEEDKSVSPSASIDILESLRRRGKDYTIHLFPGADHGMRTDPGPDFPFPVRPHVEGYREAMLSWLRERGWAE